VADAERINPRTRRVRRAILDAAGTVFLQHGADHVTAVRVAAEADVARTTIYRHWPTSADLLLATIDDLTAPGAASVASGDLETDVRTALNDLCVRLTIRDTHPVFAALASHAHNSEAFAAAQRVFIDNLTQPVQHALELAQQRGDLSAERDCHTDAIILAGPVLHQHFMLHRPPMSELVEMVVVPWLAALH